MRWLRTWFRRRRLDRDLARELETHLDIHVHHLMARGVPADAARRRARMALGGVDQVAEQVRDARSGAMFDQWLCDGRDALRGLRRTPAVTAAAIALIALVVGGNTTIYSMIHAVLTKSAPGVQGDRLVTLELRIDGRPAGPSHGYADYGDYATQSTTITPLLAFQFERFTVTFDDGTYPFNGGVVSSNYFETLGVHLVRGRAFTETEDRLDASGLVVVVSHRVWQDHFQGAEGVLGRSIVVNGLPSTIVGIAPPRFRGAWLAESSDVWVPLLAYSRMHADIAPRSLMGRSRGPILINGRLAPGVSLSRARAEFAAISARLQAAYPETNRRTSVAIVPYSMTAGGDSLVATQAPRFLAVFSLVTALTLIIVCANVANLMLGRAVARQREMALRQTLGASRARILRVLVAEGLIISIAAWLAACLFALAVSKGVVNLFPPPSNQGAALLLDLTPDWQVVVYAMVLAVLGTVAFTIAPAVHAWKLELLTSLKSGELGVVAGRSRLAGVLVIVQLGFAVLLLTSAGLAYRSLSMLGAADVGFKKDHLLLASVNTSGSSGTKDTNIALLDRLRDRVRAIPGIESVSYTGPFWDTQPVQAENAQQPLIANTIAVGSDYLRVLGLTPLAGHEFVNADARLATKAVLINQGLAESLWPGQSAMGRTLRLGARREPADVVGVTPNGQFNARRRETPNFVFSSLQQEPLPPGSATFYIRYGGELATIAPAVGRAMREVDNRVPLVHIRAMETDLDEMTAPVRIVTIWITLFAVGSLMIAAIGQYAVIAFDMRRRARDFGVRIALGASSRQILGSVILQGLRWTATGLLIGFALSLIAGRAMRSLLVGVTPTDGPTYLGVFALLALASLLACYLPARRAARIDPIHALRQE